MTSSVGFNLSDEALVQTAAAVCSAFLVACRQRQSLPNYDCLIQMQLSGQYDNVESTALAKEDRADNSDVPKIQRESIRTRRERLAASSEANVRSRTANLLNALPAGTVLNRR